MAAHVLLSQLCVCLCWKAWCEGSKGVCVWVLESVVCEGSKGVCVVEGVACRGSVCFGGCGE